MKMLNVPAGSGTRRQSPGMIPDGAQADVSGVQPAPSAQRNGIRISGDGMQRYKWANRGSPSLMRSVPPDRMAELILASTHPAYPAAEQAARDALDGSGIGDRMMADAGAQQAVPAEPTDRDWRAAGFTA